MYVRLDETLIEVERSNILDLILKPLHRQNLETQRLNNFLNLLIMLMLCYTQIGISSLSNFNNYFLIINVYILSCVLFATNSVEMSLNLLMLNAFLYALVKNGNISCNHVSW
uniref:Uncharacterized protein n=1 Tax=Glossina austeni TaxID=7395 RepID=A0A1A9VGG7_GLOAU